MVKDHSDSEKGNLLPPHRLLLSINSNGFFYMHHPTDRITHTSAFVTPVVEHWLEREIAQWVQCLFSTTSPSVSTIIGRDSFDTAPFTLPLVSDCLYGKRVFFLIYY